MPLILISGHPSSGKSTLVKKLKDFFTNEKQKEVHIICENKMLKKVMK